MTLYRANDRLDHDDRVLKIRDPQEFALWGQRRELGFKGITCPFNITDELKSAAHHFSSSRAMDSGKDAVIAILNIEFHNGVMMEGYPTDRDRERLPISLADHFRRKGILEPLQQALYVLASFYHLATNCESALTFARRDANEQTGWHTHSFPVLTVSVLRQGTRCRNSDGDGYIFNRGHMLLAEDIEHCAPVYSDAEFREEPRVNLVTYTHI